MLDTKYAADLIVVDNTDFSIESNGWESLFTNYSLPQEAQFQLRRGYGPTPDIDWKKNPSVCSPAAAGCLIPPGAKPAFFFSATTFMGSQGPMVPLMFKRVDGLPPNTEMTLDTVRVTIASNASANAGSANKSALFNFQFGVSERKPATDPYNFNAINIPLRMPMTNSLRIGDNAVAPGKNGALTSYTDKVLSTSVFEDRRYRRPTVRTDAGGHAWVWMAGFPVNQTAGDIYIRKISFTLALNSTVSAKPGSGNSLRLPF